MKSRKPSSTPSSSPAQIPRGRLWVYRILLTFLVLVLPVGLAEAVLRSLGFGYSPRFLIPSTLNEEAVWVDNPDFGRRYFPEHLVRVSQPLVIARNKPEGTFRIVVLGESAAMGDPEPAYGMPRMLEVLLENRLMGQRVEVINTAMTAINSHVLMDIAADCLPLEADAWVIYAGNNEVVGPFGPGTAFNPFAQHRSLIRLGLGLRRLRLGQWLDAQITRWGGAGQVPSDWGGVEMFQNQQIAAGDPRLTVMRRNFQANIEAILKMAARREIPVILGTVGCNLRDFPPLGTGEEAVEEFRMAQWKEDVLDFFASDVSRHVDLQQGLRGFPLPREVTALESFLVGHQLVEAGHTLAAAQCFLLARDLDPLRFRPDTEIGQILRRVGRSRPEVRFVDTEALLAQHASFGIPGDDLFWEHVHFRFHGNFELSKLFADEVLKVLEGKLAQNSTRPSTRLEWMTENEMVGHLAYTDWDRYQSLTRMRTRLNRPPFSEQWGAEERDRRFQEDLASLSGARRIQEFEKHAAIYRAALELRPQDWRLKQQYAELLRAFGDNESAVELWQDILEQMPRHFVGHFNLGKLLAAQAATAPDAESHLRRALALRDNFPEAWEQLGQALGQQQRFEDSDVAFQKALQLRPAYGDAWVNRALTWAAAGKTNQAIELLKEATRITPDYPQVYQHLGRLLLAMGRTEEAATVWETVPRLLPNHFGARLQSAQVWQRLSRPDKAAIHLIEALRLNPDHLEVRFRLGLHYAQAGDAERAKEQFQEVLRRDPEASGAHLNLGLALMSQGKVAEALTAMERALELEPDNRKLQESVEQARQLLRRSQP